MSTWSLTLNQNRSHDRAPFGLLYANWRDSFIGPRWLEQCSPAGPPGFLTRSRMTCEIRRDTVEQEQAENTEDRVVRRDGVLRYMLRGLFWPFGIVVRAYRGMWWVLGFRQPRETARVSPAVHSPARQSLAGRKRLRRVTRLLLSILPRWVQGTLGYPVSSNIGRSLSPEIRVSPTKP
ncbi:uncharacterized protein AKAME5_002791900, partial [Lates japonicus]